MRRRGVFSCDGRGRRKGRIHSRRLNAVWRRTNWVCCTRFVLNGSGSRFGMPKGYFGKRARHNPSHQQAFRSGRDNYRQHARPNLLKAGISDSPAQSPTAEQAIAHFEELQRLACQVAIQNPANRAEASRQVSETVKGLLANIFAADGEVRPENRLF